MWIKRFILFHKVRHPAEMCEPVINAFLTHLAVKEWVSASTQNQALSALLFLYRHVLGREFGDLGHVVRARQPTRLPMVLTREEVKGVLSLSAFMPPGWQARMPRRIEVFRPPFWLMSSRNRLRFIGSTNGTCMTASFLLNEFRSRHFFRGGNFLQAVIRTFLKQKAAVND
ncbi:MAG: phage integrase N-terminal SAM-like domain-containing protein [Planctomycetes bacterium]|nr:phage integrase N-terminal SAM-like domain-containing protein [Planctomycetota bacterium]